MHEINTWGVGYSSIAFFGKVIGAHGNVDQFRRTRDILFNISRKRNASDMIVLLVDIYTFGVAHFYEARSQFPELTCIVLAGDWDGYTREVKDITESEQIGLFIPKELIAALWQDEPNKYARKDGKGNPIYHLRSA
jgi:hypothetical protein